MASRQDLALTGNARVAVIALSSDEEFPWPMHSDVVEHVSCLSGKIEVHCLEPDAAVEPCLARASSAWKRNCISSGIRSSARRCGYPRPTCHSPWFESDAGRPDRLS